MLNLPVIRHFFICSGLGAILTYPAHASEEALCMPVAPAPAWLEQLPNDGRTHLQADNIALGENQVSIFSGNVVMSRGQQHLAADRAGYDRNSEQLRVEGHVRLTNQQYIIEALQGHFDLKSNQAILTDTRYESLQNRVRGEAGEIRIENPQQLTVKQASYTTCDKGNHDWLLKADQIELNQENRQGTAHGVVVEFKGLPIFYMPWLRFPIGDERLSGFLFPNFGQSDQHGNELQLPYYWNIAPAYDATITPWVMSKRGTLLHTEFRYLREQSQGQLDAEYLHNDKLAGLDRERYRLVHHSSDKPGWRADAEINFVGDTEHLADFESDLNSASTTHLIRTGTLSYHSKEWLFATRLESYQTLSGNEPYRRLPQVNVNRRLYQTTNRFNLHFDAEYVYFDHKDETQVRGGRLNVTPAISYPLQSAAGFFTPKLALHSTHYQLEQASTDPELQRDVPVFTLNTGLFFDRDTTIGGSPYLQTLEPQLFYVYVPYRNQDNLPVFDTASYPFSFNQPFSEYRFFGTDRIGDDNRITAALSTRFINQKDGSERFMARVGQVFYFDNRRVQLPGFPVETTERSHLIAELNASASRWSLGNQYQWDPELEETVISSTSLSYQYPEAFQLALTHRYQRDILETREARLDWQLSAHWKLSASQLFNVRDEYNLQTTIGLDYESCCWGLRMTAEQRYLPGSQEQEQAWYLELILKGLAGIGKSRR